MFKILLFLINLFIGLSYGISKIDTTIKCSQYSYIDQKIDQFSFENNKTFKQRYILSKEYWKPNKPIFFYTGNEADIVVFCNEIGFVWEAAQEFGAMVVFAENRYYGESLPYGNETFSKMSNLEYLVPDQVLLDFVYLIKYLKSSIKGAEKSKVIAFGGSLGGMYAAWIRAKYPHIIDGAHAASAPLLLTQGECNLHYKLTTKDFSRFDPRCSQAVRQSWSIYNQMYESSEERKKLFKMYHLCDENVTLEEFKEWLKRVYLFIAMSDYPYPSSTFEFLPAWPVKAICERITNTLDLTNKTNIIENISQGLSIFFNYTGNKKCIEVGRPELIKNDEMLAAEYQWCTGIIFPFCTDGKTDMFEPKEWNAKEYSDNCYKTYGIRPIEDWLQTQYGVDNIDLQSNIIFTVGDLDPWTAYSITKVKNDKLVTINIKDGAHHLDLLHSHPDDPTSVVNARKKIKSIIYDWISEEAPEGPNSISANLQINIILSFLSLIFLLI